MPTLTFKRGDRVMLTPAAVRYYGGAPGWTPQMQGGGKPGTIVVASDRPHKPGASPRPYLVSWENAAREALLEWGKKHHPKSAGPAETGASRTGKP